MFISSTVIFLLIIWVIYAIHASYASGIEVGRVESRSDDDYNYDDDDYDDDAPTYVE
jgi:hypothetical protein